MRNRWLGFVVAAVALAVSVWAWPRLPARVPTHWNVHGVPDGYSSRLVAALLVTVNGLGYPVAMSRLMPVGVGLLFIVLGNSLARVQPTWFVGIRTPWTLSSDTVWRKTHRTG